MISRPPNRVAILSFFAILLAFSSVLPALAGHPYPTDTKRKELHTTLRPSTAARIITERDHGRKFWFHPRQMFWVRLAEQPEGNGMWELDPLTSNSVTLVRHDRRYQDNWKYQWSRPGHAGLRTWVFQANQPGIARLIFRKQPRNPNRSVKILDIGIVIIGKDGQGTGRGILGSGHPFPKTPKEQKVVLDPAVAKLFRDIYFAYDKDKLNPKSKKRLKKIAAWMKKNPSSLVTIEGHCDERGSATYNYLLGKRRALTASHFLGRAGVGGRRLTTVSYGKMRPVEKAKGEKAWSKNRRVHFVVFE